jgi:hypothetical protein
MRTAGIDPAIIYAFRKTGLILISEQVANYSPEAIAEWNAAPAEHHALEADGAGDGGTAPEQSSLPAGWITQNPGDGWRIARETDQNHVLSCLDAMAKVERKDMTTVARIELAAFVLASAARAAVVEMGEATAEQEFACADRVFASVVERASQIIECK